jgi:enoyl-CoA hydratase
MSGNLILTVEAPLAVLTLNRPEKLNALDLDLLRALDAACNTVEADRNIRVLILTGAGKAFCAGGDIKAWGGMEKERFGHEWVRFGHRVFDRLAGLRMPVIAVLNGHAFGGGLELAACADIRVAAAGTRLGLPETGLGMVPGWSGTQRLARRFGIQTVRRMVLGGEIFTAVEALTLGLVDHLTSEGNALIRARELAATIAQRSPAAQETAKLMLVGAEGDGGAALEALASMLAAGTGDMAEGVAAFTAKRRPDFKGQF